jgi:hypothetical protein
MNLNLGYLLLKKNAVTYISCRDSCLCPAKIRKISDLTGSQIDYKVLDFIRTGDDFGNLL